MNPSKGLALFTDGSCFWKDRIGSWAWVLVDGYDNITTGSGVKEDTTISQMELMAVIEGLKSVYEDFGPSDLLVFSDSEYVVLGITDRRRKRKANQDLWYDLDCETDRHNLVIYEHIRGHSNFTYNELADTLATERRKEFYIDSTTS